MSAARTAAATPSGAHAARGASGEGGTRKARMKARGALMWTLMLDTVFLAVFV